LRGSSGSGLMSPGVREMSKPIGWQREFEDTIPLPRGGRLVTLQDAADYILKLAKAEQNLKEWQAATEALIMAAEGRGPFNSARNDQHWGRRKLARDR
jgi:hypothetical protein